MLIPLPPDADFHSSRMAQWPDAVVMLLVPTFLPFGLVTVQLPTQKSNCRNSAAVQAGGGDVADGGAGAGVGEAWQSNTSHSAPRTINADLISSIYRALHRLERTFSRRFRSFATEALPHNANLQLDIASTAAFLIFSL